MTASPIHEAPQRDAVWHQVKDLAAEGIWIPACTHLPDLHKPTQDTLWLHRYGQMVPGSQIAPCQSTGGVRLSCLCNCLGHVAGYCKSLKAVTLQRVCVVLPHQQMSVGTEEVPTKKYVYYHLLHLFYSSGS